MTEKFEVAIFEENEATYLGMEISKIKNGDFEGIVLDPNGYEDKINHIEIPHERMVALVRILMA